MKSKKIVSLVTIAIMRDEKLLLLKNGKSEFWMFPSKKFNDNLNGNLDDTVKRALGNFTDLTSKKLDYLGSFIRKTDNEVIIGYNFLIENFDGRILPKSYKWVTKNEIENIRLDKNTSVFLKIHNDLI